MKKVIGLTLVLMMCAFSFTGFAKAATSSTANSLDRVKKAGTIVIGLDNTYPPMEFSDKKNNLVGYDIDMATAVAKKLGVTVKFVPTAWDGIFLALQSKKFDAIQSTVSITDERKQTMLFSDPYVFGGNAIFVKADNKTINSQADFKGKIIGCQIGTTGQITLEKMTGMKEVKKYNGMTDAFMDLKIGRVEAVVSDPMVGDYYIAGQKGKFKRIKSMLTQEPIGVAFRKDEKELRDAYQKAINELKKDGTLTKFSIKWFGYDVNK